MNLKPIIVIAGIILAALALAGCNSTSLSTKVTEMDLATGKVAKVTESTETSEALAAQVVKSTQNKSVYIWSKGWLARLKATAATTDNPVPTLDAEAGNLDQGVLTLHKDQQNLDGVAGVIKAIHNSNLSVTSEGINGSSGEAAK